MYIKKLLTFTSTVVSLFLSEFQAKAAPVEILCPTHGKVTYDGNGTARCPQCYPAGQYDYWCPHYPSCRKWHNAPCHFFHTGIPAIPLFIEKFFHNGYGDTNNSETARLGNADEWKPILSDMLKKEITDLPRAQAVSEALSWYMFYTQEKGVYFSTSNNCSINWDLYKTLLNADNRPKFSTDNYMAHVRAPDKLLEDIAKMGPSFEEMCKSFGWIRTNDDASDIWNVVCNHFKDLGIYFDFHTKRLKQGIPIRHRFNFFSLFDDGGEEFIDKRIENDDSPIEERSSPALGNVLLGELASVMDRKRVSDPTIHQYRVLEKCFIEVEDSIYLYLRQLVSNTTDLRQKLAAIEILLNHLSEKGGNGASHLPNERSLIALQKELTRELKNPIEQPRINRVRLINALREQMPKDLPPSYTIRIAISEATKTIIPQKYLEKEANGYIKTIPLHEMLKQNSEEEDQINPAH